MTRVTPFAKEAKPAPRYGGLVPPLDQQIRELQRYIQISLLVMIVMQSLSCTQSHNTQTLGPWLSFNWPAADSLFQRDNHWVGGDGAYSIDLGNERVLWLFGDSWIDPKGKGNRQNAVMVSNTLAIQRGYDPCSASIKFFWNQNKRKTEAFFPDDTIRYWPGHGIRLEETLLLFLMGVHKTDIGLGFEVKDWKALLISNPNDDPDKWEVEYSEAKSNRFQIIVGSGGVLQWKNYIYAFSAKESDPKHDIYLVRWSIENITEGQLDLMQWWCGDQTGWSNQAEDMKDVVPVFNNGQTEFTVHYDERDSVLVEIQTDGFGSAQIVRRTASSINGPWSEPETIFSPAQNQFPGIMIYQGKAHPYLIGADPVLSYCTNSFDFADHFLESWIYYPRFVRIQKSQP